ncbi:MAG: BON domain-containing protein [Thermodesulfovibrionales bacterium]
MKIKIVYTVVLLAVVVLLAPGLPLHAATLDDRIRESAENSYVFRTYLQGDDIKVRSEDGVVSLTGTVADESHRSLAQETVAGLPGVKSVDNRLEVKGEQPAEKSDARISANVKAALMLHRSVSANTEVSSKDGIVTLRGEAVSLAEKDLTTEYARDVEGVRDVINEMTVLKRSDNAVQTVIDIIDDASISAQVRTSLLLHRSTSVLRTRVVTRNGVVTLSGKAANTAEIDLVSKLVRDVKGVKSINNQMTVEGYR